MCPNSVGHRDDLGAYLGVMPIGGVVLGGQVLDTIGVRRAGRVVVMPCWSQSRHHQVSTDAIASILITSVTGRQTVTVMVLGSFLERRVTSAR
jgi:hypothetical protein